MGLKIKKKRWIRKFISFKLLLTYEIVQIRFWFIFKSQSINIRSLNIFEVNASNFY